MTPRFRIFILGAGGFVGRHLVQDLQKRFGGSAKIFASSRRGEDGLAPLDLTDDAGLRDALNELRPTHIVNLVGIPAPAEARKAPALSWELHAIAPQRLGRLVLEIVPDCWLLHVSSGLVYGHSALSVPILDETALLRPVDDYGVTKAAGDLAMGALAQEGLNCLRLRPFNHTGPGQSDSFALPAFASQIARIEAGLQPPILHTGNLESVRDFLDVRDVAAAYGHLISISDRLEPGQIFNIASGQGLKISVLLDKLMAGSHVSISVEANTAGPRGETLPTLIGDASALKKHTGWVPQYCIEDTLRDLLLKFRSGHTNLSNDI